MNVEFIIGGTHLTASFGGAVMVGELFTPRIGENGNWFVGDTDTGVSATKLSHPLKFKGAITATYDGSEPVEVEIPEGESDTGGGPPVINITKIEGGHQINITDANGSQQFDVMNGTAGYTPEKGTDYWTEADKAAMVADVLNALPTWEGGRY